MDRRPFRYVRARTFSNSLKKKNKPRVTTTTRMRMINSHGNYRLENVCVSPDTNSFTLMPVFPPVREGSLLCFEEPMKPRLREVTQLCPNSQSPPTATLLHDSQLILPLTSKSPSSWPLKIRRPESISFMESKYQTHRHPLIPSPQSAGRGQDARRQGVDLGATPVSQSLRP